jgi:hypothetical protein
MEGFGGGGNRLARSMHKIPERLKLRVIPSSNDTAVCEEASDVLVCLCDVVESV